MQDNFDTFFANSDFDIHEPHSGHEARFLRKLKQPKKKFSISYKWMSVAAAVILFLGFYLGSSHQKRQYDLADVSPKMAEAQNFFVTTISNELKQVEKFRNLDTEIIIEDALEEIEELEDQYKLLQKDLNNTSNKSPIIQNMIHNFQQRLSVLETLLSQLELVKQNKPQNEII